MKNASTADGGVRSGPTGTCAPAPAGSAYTSWNCAAIRSASMAPPIAPSMLSSTTLGTPRSTITSARRDVSRCGPSGSAGSSSGNCSCGMERAASSSPAVATRRRHASSTRPAARSATAPTSSYASAPSIRGRVGHQESARRGTPVCARRQCSRPSASIRARTSPGRVSYRSTTRAPLIPPTPTSRSRAAAPARPAGRSLRALPRPDCPCRTRPRPRSVRGARHRRCSPRTARRRPAGPPGPAGRGPPRTRGRRPAR